jgi:hypothetical protein
MSDYKKISSFFEVNAPSLGAIFRQPAIWITLAFFATVAEGAIRKWIPGFGAGLGRIIAYCSKDLLMALGVILLVNRSWCSSLGLEVFRKWGSVALGLIILGGIGSIGTNLSFSGAFLTFRSMVILPFLAYLYARLSGRSFPLLGLSCLIVLFTIVNGLLSLAQNSLPSDHIINKYASEGLFIVEVAFGVRATGTFAYITGLGTISAIGLWAGLVTISLYKKKWQLIWGVSGVLAALACAFSSISRNTVVTAFVMLVVWGLNAVQSSRIVLTTLLIGASLASMITLLAPNLASRFEHVAEGTLDRFDSAGDNNVQRAVGQWSEMLSALRESPLGRGIGLEQVGGNYVSSGQMTFTTFESQFPRIVAEMGVFGFLAFLITVAAVVLGLQTMRVGIGDPRWNLVVSITQIYVLGQCYTNVVFNHTASSFVWLTVASVFAADPALTGSPVVKTRMYSPKKATVSGIGSHIDA